MCELYILLCVALASTAKKKITSCLFCFPFPVHFSFALKPTLARQPLGHIYRGIWRVCSMCER